VRGFEEGHPKYTLHVFPGTEVRGVEKRWQELAGTIAGCEEEVLEIERNQCRCWARWGEEASNIRNDEGQGSKGEAETNTGGGPAEPNAMG